MENEETIPLLENVKKMANNSKLSLDIPKEITDKYPEISRYKSAIVKIQETKDKIRVIYQFDKKKK